MKRILTRYALTEIWLIAELFLLTASFSVPHSGMHILSSAAEGDRFYLMTESSLLSLMQDGKTLWEFRFSGTPLSMQLFRQEIYILTSSYLYSISLNGRVTDSTANFNRYSDFCRIDQYYAFYDAMEKKVLFSHFSDGSNFEFSYRIGKVLQMCALDGRSAAILGDSGVFTADADGINFIKTDFHVLSLKSSKGYLLIEDKEGGWRLWSREKGFSRADIRINEPAAFDYPYILEYDSTVTGRLIDE